MIFTAIVVLALYSMYKLGIDMLPKIEPPVITVIATYPGASPQDVEIKVTEPLENQLGTTPGLEKITSVSSEGAAIVSLKFLWGTNLDEASNDIRDRIELAKRFLPDIPDEMDNPFIFKFNTANIPILFVGFTGRESYPSLYNLVDKQIGDNLRQLPGVGTVQIQGGGMERQINIYVDRNRLEGYGFSVLDIQNVLQQENITQPVGNLKTGLTDYLIRLPGEFASPDEIKLVILGKRDGTIVYLKDVARIEDGFKEITSKVRINNNPGVMVMIQKQSGTNTVEVTERVKKKLEELKKNLPQDVQAITIFDTSSDIIRSLHSLTSSVWVAILLVIVVVWFFLRQFLPSMIVGLTIPFSLLISFIYLFLSGKTINVISLTSLAIASGMVVDNAIVVVDNIARHIERGQRAQEAAIFGAREMFLAIAASTLTTVVVFVPMLFIPGVVGIMFGEMAVIIIVTLTASLFTAATFTPMLCSRWMRVNPEESFFQKIAKKFYDFSERLFIALESFYSGVLNFCLHHKKMIIVVCTLVFLGSLLLLPFVGTEFIPEEDSGDLRITVYLPVGTRLEESDKIAGRIESILRTEIPEAKYYYARCGQVTGVGRSMGNASGPNIITAGAKLIPKDKRKRSVQEVGHVIRKKITQIPGVTKTTVMTGNPLGRIVTGAGGKSVQVDIIGNSFADTNALAERMKVLIEKIPGTVDVSISREMDRPELQIKVDREKAASLGLSMSQVASSVKTFLAGSTATKYREQGETYDISVRLEELNRSRKDDIENLSIVSQTTGETIKLSTIAAIRETKGLDDIERQNRERIVHVECNVYKRSPGEVITDIKKQLASIALPVGVTVNFGGDAEEQRKAFSDLALLLVLGIALVYMVMAAQFESLYHPFLVMFAVPFTFIGVIIAFAVTRVTLSIISFLGLVMLMGIVVNNAIVLVSYINILRARGYTMLEAVTQSGKDRLRPVLMTTITTLVGLLPLAFSTGEGSETWQPLGITMIGGLSISTFFTLLFVPTVYAGFESLKTRIRRKPRKAE